MVPVLFATPRHWTLSCSQHPTNGPYPVRNTPPMATVLSVTPRDMTVYFVLSTFTYTPISLLPTNKAVCFYLQYERVATNSNNQTLHLRTVIVLEYKVDKDEREINTSQRSWTLVRFYTWALIFIKVVSLHNILQYVKQIHFVKNSSNPHPPHQPSLGSSPRLWRGTYLKITWVAGVAIDQSYGRKAEKRAYHDGQQKTLLVTHELHKYTKSHTQQHILSLYSRLHVSTQLVGHHQVFYKRTNVERL
jgi:hypothetical protein